MRTADPIVRTPLALRTPTPTPTPTASTVYAAGVGWDAAPTAREYGVGGPFAIVGFACAQGLPPGATVIVRATGNAGARPSLGVQVGMDGSVVVPFGLLRPGEVTWEFQSITLKDGSSYGMLPPGRTATATTTDQPCEAT
jgi:hypothetical protein